MIEKDKADFEKWLDKWSYPLYGKSSKEFHPDHIEWMKKSFDDVISQDREKTNKMIDELNALNDHVFEHQISFYVFHKINNIIRKYKGEI